MGGENVILKLIQDEIERNNVKPIFNVEESVSLENGYFYFAGKYISFPDIFYYGNDSSFLVEIKSPYSKEFNEDPKKFSRAVQKDGLIDIDSLISKIASCSCCFPCSFSYSRDLKLALFFLQKEPIHRNDITLSKIDFTHFVNYFTLYLKNHYNNCVKGYFCTIVPSNVTNQPPLILKIKNTLTNIASYFNLASDGLSEAIAYALRLNTPEVWYTNMKTLYIVKNLREDVFQTRELESIQEYQLTLLYLDSLVSTSSKPEMDQKRQEIFDTIRKVSEEKNFLKDGENLDIKALTIQV